MSVTAPPRFPLTDDEIAAYVDAAAAMLGLPIAPAHRPGVLRYFALAARMAAVIDAVPLSPNDDPAPTFTPVGPPGTPEQLVP